MAHAHSSPSEHSAHVHAHGGGHSHAGGHAHGHGHGPKSYGRAFAIGVTLNLAFVVIEVFYGIVSHSIALLSDAGHNFGDVLGLAFAWGAAALANVRPSARRTFGYRRSTIVASMVNALLLLVVTGALVWESIRRLFDPLPAQGKTMVVVALVGAAINLGCALLFMREDKDLNVRTAFMHLAADAVLSLGVAATGALILVTNWLWLDPVMSLVLAVTIFAGTWSLLRQSLNLMLDAVPEGIETDHVRDFLNGLPGVLEVHDLHIWGMSTTETALTAHLVMNNPCQPAFLAEVCAELHAKFDIDHSTLQLDPVDAPSPCSLASDDVV